jgi:hypothetical protein
MYQIRETMKDKSSYPVPITALHHACDEWYELPFLRATPTNQPVADG